MQRFVLVVILVVSLALAPASWGKVYFSPGQDCTKAVIAHVEAETAPGPILIEAYSFTDADILEALKASVKRGVKIIAMTDYKVNFTNKNSISRPLATAGGTVVYDKAHPISHSKVFIFTQQKLILTGSFNYSRNARKNHENMLEVTDPQDIQVFLHAINRKHFFDKGIYPNNLRSFGDPAGIAVLGVYLPDPAGIPIAGRTDEGLRMNFAEMEGFQVAFEVDGHGPV